MYDKYPSLTRFAVNQPMSQAAGREVRVIVHPHQVTDRTALKICRGIAKAVEEQLTYPGEVKVTVLRETRVVEYAR